MIGVNRDEKRLSASEIEARVRGIGDHRKVNSH